MNLSLTVRAPCPMLNTLANHGFLPHNGQNITEFDTINALYTALNVNQTLGEFLFKAALTTNPTPNATTFSLDNLSRHNILEHDASLRLVYISPSTLHYWFEAMQSRRFLLWRRPHVQSDDFWSNKVILDCASCWCTDGCQCTSRSCSYLKCNQSDFHPHYNGQRVQLWRVGRLHPCAWW